MQLHDLVARASSYGMPALALTDQGNLYGAVDFFKACKGAAIKPIIGCELYLAPGSQPGSRFEKRRTPGVPFGYPLVLLAENSEGYRNLCMLSSKAHLEGFYYAPRIDKELLAQHSAGLICLTGSLQGLLPSLILRERWEELQQEISWLADLFPGSLFFELQRHKMTPQEIAEDGMASESWLLQAYEQYVEQQERVLQKFVQLSQEHAIPCVATQSSCYLDRADWRAHEVLINIQSGEPCEIWLKDSMGHPKERVPNPKREVMPSHAFQFKSSEQMAALFADLPEALKASGEIADRCQWELDFKTRYYPVFVPPELEGKSYTPEERVTAASDHLRKLCEEGISLRYDAERLAKVAEKYPGREPMEVIKERLEYELSVIIPKGMCDYLLIVYDFISWAKRQGIPMGPGRGSGAGSIVLYLIGVTDIEPLRFNLFFERFINPERISYPDIDVDICMDRRQEVIDYTVSKYGKDKVAQIITFGTMKAKMAIKDVGRVLNIPLQKVLGIAKLVPEDLGITIEKALEADPELRALYQSDEETRRCIDLARKLEGSLRNTGIHAAGLIVSGDPLMEHIPICAAKDSDVVATQFSMKPVEAVGMLKIDFLGLKTLTSIQRTTRAIETRTGKAIDWINLPLEDQAAFDLLNQGRTLGLFQVESGGMQELLKQLHLDKFEEVIAVGALYRPGPMEMIPSFIERKHGREPIEIDHPWMADILAETYGIMVYQEQVMQIASRLAGYSLGEGDVLRRAMGKKDHEEMSRQREKFRIGALSKGVDEATAMQIFDKVEKFASYGFNKSHAAAYGYLTYVTAYLKANYPKEWMASLLTSDRDDITKVSRILKECQAMGIAILPPDVNESGTEFVATETGVRFALNAIKGVGEGVIELVVQGREEKGRYSSLFDFLSRIDTRKVGKKMVEHLIEAGAFDFTGWSRDQLLAGLDPMFHSAARQQREMQKGVLDLFGSPGEKWGERFETPPDLIQPRSTREILQRENQLLGFYLTGHPLDEYQTLLKQLSCLPLSLLLSSTESIVARVGLLVEEAEVRLSSKTQKKFCILTLSDGEERIELPVWSDLYEAKNQLFESGQLLYGVLTGERTDGEWRWQLKWVHSLTEVQEEQIREADSIYDRCKADGPRGNKWNRSDSQARKKKPEPVPAGPQGGSPSGLRSGKVAMQLKIEIDLDKLRLSHFLELKRLCEQFAGSASLQLRLVRSGSGISTVVCGEGWSVNPSEEFISRVKALPSISDLALLS